MKVISLRADGTWKVFSVQRARQLAPLGQESTNILEDAVQPDPR